MTEPAFTLFGTSVSLLEAAAFVLALAGVVASIVERAITWPLNIAASALYGVLFAATQLPGQAALQAVFIAVSVYGWVQWRRDGAGAAHAPGAPAAPSTRSAAPAAALPIARLTAADRWRAAALWLLGWALLAALLARSSAAPVLEALPTAGSLLGQWLLARKCLETWPTWVLVNGASVVLFAGQGLLLTAALYALLAVLALLGAWRWAASVPHPRRALFPPWPIRFASSR